ncbi:MAG: hypothetical protein MJY95_02250 [Bacteroidaceae bacterium]|nr:hypothetical protein [Bacteroidaceae bacterium]
MMKKLLSLSIALLMTVGAMAQWTLPTYNFVPFQTVEDFEESGTFFYLYNPAAEMFFGPGNSWGTQGSITYNPSQAYFTKAFEEGETEEEWAEWPHYFLHGNIWRNNDPTQEYLGWKTAFFDGHGGFYLDGLPADMNGNYQGGMFEIYENGDGTFQIAPSLLNPTLNDYELRLGVDLTQPGNTGVALFYPDEEPYEGAYALNWALITPEEFEENQEALLTYAKAMQLQALLDELLEEYTEEEIDFTNAFAILENTSSTLDELEAAMTDLNEQKIAADLIRQQELKDIIFEGATEDDPNDVTAILVNPDFSCGDDHGWTMTINEYTDRGYHDAEVRSNGEAGIELNQFCQFWRYNDTLGIGEISQTIEDLPAGRFSFEVDAIGVNQRDVNSTKGVELFALGGEIEAVQAIKTRDNIPEHFIVNFVSTGGDVTLGVRTVEGTNATWIAVDNFQLWFYGEFEDDPYKEILDDYIEQLEEKYAYMDEIFANAEIKEAYETALDEAKNATEDFDQAKKNLEEKVAALDASIKDYETLASAMEYADNRRLEFEDTWPDLSELIADLLEFGVEGISEQGWSEMYEDGTADSELCNNALETVESIISDYICENLKAGDFVTPLIKNPDFKDGFDSWSVNGSRPAFGGKEGNGLNTLGDVEVLESGNAEVYHNAFDMFQTIKNMPKGSFTLTCQAFQRNEGRDWASDYFVGPEEGITAVLYANEFEAKVCNFAAGAQEEEVFHSSNESWESDIYNEVVGGYLPNSMTGANFFFNISPETYQVKVNFTLAEAGKDITIGLKNADTNSWVIFDNFNIVYNGSDYSGAINDLIASINSVLENESSIFGNDAKEKADEAINNLLKASASGDEDECIAAIKAGNEVLAYVKESAQLYNALMAAFDELSIACGDYEMTASEELLSQADELLDKVIDAMDQTNLTNEEVQSLINQVNKMASALSLPDFSGASEETPVDFTELIENPDFTDANLGGWLGTEWGRGGNVADGAEQYSKNFDTYLEFKGLPEGVYGIFVQGFYRRGNSNDDYNIWTTNKDSLAYAVLYAQVADGEFSVPIVQPSSAALPVEESLGESATVGGSYAIPSTMVGSDAWFQAGYYMNSLFVTVGEDGNLRFGAKKGQTINTDWAIFDNWALYYYGNETTPEAVGIEDVKTAQSVAKKGIYTLAGQKVSNASKGLYIMDGKKVLVK